MSASSATFISVLAALVSAGGTALAAFAALKSAQSAEAMRSHTLEAERQATLRETELNAIEIIALTKRVWSCGEATKVAYNDLAIFTGNLGGSRNNTVKNKVVEKVERAEAMRDHALLFREPNSKLDKAPNEEINRVSTILLGNIKELTLLREELEEECSYVRGLCAPHQERAIKSLQKQHPTGRCS